MLMQASDPLDVSFINGFSPMRQLGSASAERKTSLRAVWVAGSDSRILCNQPFGKAALGSKAAKPSVPTPLQIAFMAAVEDRLGCKISDTDYDFEELGICIEDVIEDLLDGRGLIIWNARRASRSQSNIELKTFELTRLCVSNPHAIAVVKLSDEAGFYDIGSLVRSQDKTGQEINVMSANAEVLRVRVNTSGFLPTISLLQGDEDVAYEKARERTESETEEPGAFSPEFTAAYNLVLRTRSAQRALLEVIREPVLTAVAKVTPLAVPTKTETTANDGRPRRPAIGAGGATPKALPETGSQP